MKCVCPMGGDRTCPDDCPLAVWASLSPTDRIAQRKVVAERLYRDGFTMEAIATQLGVSAKQISRDLADFDNPLKLKPAKTETNPKGAGRPKGTRKPGETQKQRSINARPEDWERFKEKAEAEGKSVAEKLGEIVAEPEIDRASLSLTAQEKLDTAIRQHKRRLMDEWGRAVDERVTQRINEIMLPYWKQKIEEAQELYARRQGLMDKDTFNAIRRALHPDSRNSISDKKLGEAFDAFMALEKFLLAEKDSPTELPDLPKTWADWEKAKQRATAERRARRTHHSSLRPA